MRAAFRCLSILTAALWLALPADAQVIRDGSIGPGGPGLVAGGIDDLGQPATYLIHEGLAERAGTNLFHSFDQFSVGSGETTTFTALQPTDNVLGRVTGGSESQIFGRLRSTIPGAALWLLNPAGWLFGKGSSLDVPGSFHVSSGHYFKHADGTRFSATGGAPPVLSVAPIEAFGFLDAPIGNIVLDDARFVLETGSTLSLIGGDVEIRGPGGALPEDREVVVDAPSGLVRLAGIASEGDLPTSDWGEELLGEFGDVRVVDGAEVVLTGNPVGRLQAVAHDVLLDQSGVTANATGDVDAIGPALEVFAQGQVVIRESDVTAGTFGAGRGGGVEVTAEELQVVHDPSGSDRIFSLDRTGEVQGSFVQTASDETGQAGDIVLRVGSLVVDGLAEVGTFLNPTSTAPGAHIVLRAESIRVVNGGSIRTVVFGSGDGGLIDVDADSVVVQGISAVVSTDVGARDRLSNLGSTTRFNPDHPELKSGDASDLQITAQRLEVLDGAVISVASQGGGDGGRILIQGDEVLVAGAAVRGDVFGNTSVGSFLSAVALHSGFSTGDFTRRSENNAGSIEILARKVSLLDGGLIATVSFSNGDAGPIHIEANELIMSGLDAADLPEEMLLGGSVFRLLFQRSWISSGSNTAGRFDGAGAGADIVLLGVGEDSKFELTDGAFIDSITWGNTTDGGDTVIAFDHVVIGSGSGISNASVSNPANPAPGGDASDIVISAKVLTIDGGRLATDSTARTGDGGNIVLNVSERLEVFGGPDHLSVCCPAVPGGSITTEVRGSPETTGGNITISNPDFVILENGARIIANATEGQGGNIDITTKALLVSDDSVISASSELGVSGTVQVNAPDSDLTTNLETLSQD